MEIELLKVLKEIPAHEKYHIKTREKKRLESSILSEISHFFFGSIGAPGT
jgi:hypothetical protein